MIAFLLEKKADRTAKAYRIDKPAIFIGRGADNDIVINHMSVSTRHAKIFVGADGKFYIEDLKSSNGVFVNRERITVSLLKNGDEILLGAYPFDFVIEGVSAPAFEKKAVEKPFKKEEKRNRSPLPLIIVFIFILALTGALFLLRQKPSKVEKRNLPPTQSQQKISNLSVLLEEGKKFYEDALLFKNTGRYKDAMESLELSTTYFDEALLSDPENQTAIEYKRKIQKELEEMPSEGVVPKVWEASPENVFEDNEKGNEIIAKMELYLKEAENYSRAGDSKKALANHRNVLSLYNELKKISVSDDIVKKGESISEKSRDYLATNYFETSYYFLLNEFSILKKALEENQIFRANSLCKSFIEKSEDFIQKNKRFRGKKLSKIMELNKSAKQMKKELTKKVDSLRTEAEALFNEGVLLEKVGSYSQAIKKWKQALEKTHPDDKELITKIKNKLSQYEE